MEQKTIVKYGLGHIESGKMLGVSVSSNEGADFCGSTQTTLYYSSSPDWLVDTPEHAEWVRHNSTEWYNAGYDTPTHSYEPEELVVVKVTQTFERTEAKVPSNREILEWRKSKNPREATLFDMWIKEREEKGTADAPCDDWYQVLQYFAAHRKPLTDENYGHAQNAGLGEKLEQ